MDELWPPLEDGLLAHLKRTYVTPLRLEAAFDNDEECLDMLTSEFPDIVEEDALDAVAQLSIWKDSVERPLKRSRGEVVRSVMFRLPTRDQALVHEEFTRLTQTSALCILEMHAKRRQRKYKEDPADARARRFETERKKYAWLLAQVIIQAKLPVVELIQVLDDPQSGWVRIFAARRGNALKNRYKSWKPFEMWLEWNRGYLYPRGVKDAIDFMQHRVNDGCGRTIPEGLQASLSLIEQLGRVPEDVRISEDVLWKGHVKSWTAELAEDAPPKKPAEMYTVAVVLALELTVVDETEMLFTRALAWVTLCMVWGAMRCDDVQAVLPHRMLLSNYGLRLVLGKSKTSGPDKPQKEVSVHVCRTISLSGSDWLKTGYDIWSEDPFVFRRDYLVMEPNKDWSGVKRKFLPPSGLSSAISKLLGSLCCPKRAYVGWELMPAVHLLPDGLECFYSGHSPRNFLTSVAAAIGFSRDERAYLGRWAMGMASSEEYVRTSRQVVFKIQRAVNQALVDGTGGPFFEDESIGRLVDFAAESGANPNRIRKRHSVMSNWTGKMCLGGTYPTLEVFQDDWDNRPDAVSDQDLAEKVASLALKEKVGGQVETKYFITVSRRTALRRLHLSGCFVKPDRCGEVIHVNEVNQDDFDSICQACRKKMRSDCGRDGGDQSSATASWSSTASDCSLGDIPVGAN
eukprot:s272_g30.t1